MDEATRQAYLASMQVDSWVRRDFIKIAHSVDSAELQTEMLPEERLTNDAIQALSWPNVQAGRFSMHCVRSSPHTNANGFWCR